MEGTKTVLTNAFSINMLNGDADIHFKKISVTETARLLSMLPCSNAIGHADTDAVVRCHLEGVARDGGLSLTIPVGKRETVKFDTTVILVVAQYKGPRLPEGATVLPVGAEIEFWAVSHG